MTIDINEAAARIGIPADLWAGRCYEISSALVEAGIVDGEAVYGHYLGEVAPGTLFADRPIVRHGWVLRPDGTIVDPTRWVFEDVAPYVYEGPGGDEYDRGGNRLREEWREPAPEYIGPPLAITFPGEADDFVHLSLLHDEPDSGPYDADLPDRVIDWEQAFWLANLPLSALGQYAEPIYQALRDAGQGALIPFDNAREVLG